VSNYINFEFHPTWKFEKNKKKGAVRRGIGGSTPTD